MGRFSPGCFWALLFAVALVFHGSEGMPVNRVSGSQFAADVAPFMGVDGVPFISVENMRQRLDVTKEGYNPEFAKNKRDFLQFGDLGDSISPDPNRADPPDKELADLEYQMRQTFIVQQRSVRRMVKLKRRLEALSARVKQQAGIESELGEDDTGGMSSHEIEHVLAWQPKVADQQTDSYPSMKDVEGHINPPPKPKSERTLGEDEAEQVREDVRSFLASGLRQSFPTVQRQLYEEIEDLKDLTGNAHELASITNKVTQHVSASQQSHVNDLGAAYFVDHKVRAQHHKSETAKVGRAQLRKLAGVQKLNSFITSENAMAQNKLQSMLKTVKQCKGAFRHGEPDENSFAGLAQNVGLLTQHLNGLLKRQAHVARQTLKKADGMQAYVSKLRKQLHEHELTPKEAGIMP